MRSHFVPQFYLKNFGDVIYCYDKKTKNVHKSNPHNIGLQKDFYGGAKEDKTNPVETAMCELEGKASAVIKKIIDTLGYSRLSDKAKSDFCLFVALQFLRTLEARTKTTQIMQKLIDAHAEPTNSTSFKMRPTKEGEVNVHLDAMDNYTTIAFILGKMGVVVCSNATDVPLWTSDNPLCLFNNFDQHPFGNLGFVSKGIEVHIPLAPSVEVVFFDPVTYPKDGISEIFPMDQQHVIHRNYLQTQQSTRFMFSNTAKFFMANEYLERDPESSDVGRERFSSGIFKAPATFRQRPEFWMDPSQFGV